ncbi:MAG: ATP-binding protein [bacterium]|nr:ATP-binding protein [bacterium]
METPLQSFVEMCAWDPSRFFIISGNVFGPLIYYSHFLAIILALAVGFFVFFQNKKSLQNRLLFLVMLAFSAWVFFDLILWANERPDFIMFFWSMILLVEPLVYALCVYFIDVFIEKKDISFKKKVGIFSLLLPIIFLLPTQFTLISFDLSNCYREPIEGPVATYYIYLLEIVYSFWILFFAFRKLNRPAGTERKQIILITSGIMLFLLSFVSGNIVGSITENWTLAQIGLFCIPIFAVFLAYMIVKFKTFNAKMIAAQALVFALAMSVLGILFVRNIENIRMVAFGTLILILIVGYLLVRGVKREIEQRERLAELNVSLRDLIKQRESLVHLITHKVKGSFTRTKFIFAGILDGTFGDITPEIKKIAEQGLEFDKGGIETVDLVLNVANLQNGLIKYDMKPVDFKDVVTQTVEEKRLAVEAKGLKMELSIEKERYQLLGDAFWLKEVVNNLIENSIKYTKEGKIMVSLSDGGKILLSVKDTGLGITEEDKKNLFTEGGRGKDSVKVNVDSTGYGLFTVKMIVEAHKGRVWAESEGQGKGSQFYVELPMS